MLLFDRGISGKIAGQEIRSLRTALPPTMPLLVSGRAVNLLAKPIPDVRTAADFSSVMTAMRELGVLPVVAGVAGRRVAGAAARLTSVVACNRPGPSAAVGVRVRGAA